MLPLFFLTRLVSFPTASCTILVRGNISIENLETNDSRNSRSVSPSFFHMIAKAITKFSPGIYILAYTRGFARVDILK